MIDFKIIGCKTNGCKINISKINVCMFNKINFDSDDIALIENDKIISYRKLLTLIIEAHDYLISIKTKRVATIIDNCIEWVVIDFACQMANVVFIPLPHFFSQSQIEHALKKTSADTVFIDAEQSSLFNGINHFDLHENGCFFEKSSFEKIKCYVTTQIQTQTVELPIDTAKITFTSGSTGQPKGVCLSQQNQLLVASSLVDTIAISKPKHLCLLPLSTLLENIAGIYAPLISGGSVVLVSAEKRGLAGSSKLDPQKLLSCISLNQPDSLILVPELLSVLVFAAEKTWPIPASLQFIAVGGSKVTADLLSRAARVNLPVYQGYGLSECSSVVCLCTPQNNQPGSVGQALPHVDLSVENNEIVIEGNLFLGYLDDKAGWYPAKFYSGDLGQIKNNQICFIEGRRKNLIITSFGRNISPEWIESEFLQPAIHQHDGVLIDPVLQQCFVFGDARPYCVALIVPLNPQIATQSISKFMAEVNKKLPDYAQIKKWKILSEPLSQKDNFLTDNNRPKRSVINQVFNNDIESLYFNPEESTDLNNSQKTGEKPMNFFQRLINETQQAKNYLFQAPIISRCLSGKINKDDYAAFLKEAYHHVKHTVPLLMNVGSKLPENKEWLREAVAEYIEEELGHQEWILNDIAACGFDKEDVRSSQPAWATELMVAFAYDSINRINPLAFFGMVHVLEGTSIALADMAADSISKVLVIPGSTQGVAKNAFSYLRSHGSLDIEHVKFFESLMNKITDEPEQQLIIDAANKFYHLYGDIFYSLNASHGIRVAA